MAKANAFRLRATECQEDAENEPHGQQKRRLEQIAEGWRHVTESQAWLDGEVPAKERTA